jgi:LDH2 family malate/lactate/ureidoglycolate dehydrogenase
MKSKTIKIENLFMYCKTLFEKAGVPEDEAYINDDNVVDANLMKVESHGVPRIPIPKKNQEAVNLRSELRVVQDRPGTAVIDACQLQGWG